jgi:hypothetical protein
LPIVHLKAAEEWRRLWDVILPSISYTLNLGIEKKYKQLDLKISKLVATQAEKPRTKFLFYPRVINNSDITFTDEELILLNKGLKYNLNYKNNKQTEHPGNGSRDSNLNAPFPRTRIPTLRSRPQPPEAIQTTG